MADANRWVHPLSHPWSSPGREEYRSLSDITIILNDIWLNLFSWQLRPCKLFFPWGAPLVSQNRTLGLCVNLDLSRGKLCPLYCLTLMLPFAPQGLISTSLSILTILQLEIMPKRTRKSCVRRNTPFPSLQVQYCSGACEVQWWARGILFKFPGISAKWCKKIK